MSSLAAVAPCILWASLNAAREGAPQTRPSLLHAPFRLHTSQGSVVLAPKLVYAILTSFFNSMIELNITQTDEVGEKRTLLL